MPRNVRNFWLDGSIDGRSSGISGGPQAKDGGFTLRIQQRDNGEVSDGILVSGWVGSQGQLHLTVDHGGEEVFRQTTNRNEDVQRQVIVGGRTVKR